MARFLQSQPAFPRTRKGEVRQQLVHDILTRVVYLCPNRGCASYGKSIRRATIEEEFERLISEVKPCEGVHKAAMAMFKDAWDLQARSVDDRVTQLRKNLHEITTQIDHLVDRITQTEVTAVVAAYERRLRGLEEEKLAIEDRRRETAELRRRT